MTAETTECTCELCDATTLRDHARGEPRFVRGDPSGCPIHETAAERDRRIERGRRRAEAMLAARTRP